MTRIYVNNFSTRLDESVSPSDTSFDLIDASGLGSPSGGDFIACTIDDNAGTVEIIHVTAVSSNTITCLRGREGTSAETWAGTEVVQARLTADGMDEKLNIGDLEIPAPAITLLDAVSASSSLSLDFTGLGDYSFIEFVFNDIIPGADDHDFLVRTSTNNGSSYDAGGTDYAWAFVGRSGTSTQETSSSGDNAISLCQGTSGLEPGNGANSGISGFLRLYNPGGLLYTRVTYQIGFINSDGNPASYCGSGYRKSAGDVDAIRFIFSSVDIASGYIYAYGMSKS